MHIKIKEKVEKASINLMTRISQSRLHGANYKPWKLLCGLQYW
jgi:hypothetical protein